MNTSIPSGKNPAAASASPSSSKTAKNTPKNWSAAASAPSAGLGAASPLARETAGAMTLGPPFLFFVEEGLRALLRRRSSCSIQRSSSSLLLLGEVEAEVEVEVSSSSPLDAGVAIESKRASFELKRPNLGILFVAAAAQDKDVCLHPAVAQGEAHRGWRDCDDEATGLTADDDGNAFAVVDDGIEQRISTSFCEFQCEKNEFQCTLATVI